MTRPGDRLPEARAVLARLLVDVPDFPEPGVVFKDITPVLADPDAFAAVVDALTIPGRSADGTPAVDKVLGLEARGFVLGAPVALALGAGFVPVRKSGKLPRAVHAVSYTLEYGEATLEMHTDAVGPGERVLVVDDVLATGGTAAAAVDLVRAAGGVPVALSLLLELSFLAGRERLEGLPIAALMAV